MSFQSVNKDWEGLAQQDALWAILTNPDKAGNKWDKNDFFASGRNEIRVVFEYLKTNGLLPVDNNKAMDFGCGVGRLTRALSDLFLVVDGIDVSPTMIAKANELNKEFKDRMFFFVNQNTKTNYEDNNFSFIYTTIVLQHIPYPQQVEYIAEFTRILKPGGVLVFQIPTKDIRHLSLIQKVKSTVKIRERLSKIGIGSYHHMQMNSVNENEIIKVLEDGNCKVSAHLFTNHTDVDFGGNLKFLKREESEGYESSMFIARKTI
ncbi:MAG: class I SAM-dependent methyltransferase [Bacteroidia bacterium]